MKIINYLFLGVILIALLAYCNKDIEQDQIQLLEESVTTRSNCETCNLIEVDVDKSYVTSNCCYFRVTVTNNTGCPATYTFSQYGAPKTVTTSVVEYEMLIASCFGEPAFYSIGLVNAFGVLKQCYYDSFECGEDPDCTFCSGGGIASSLSDELFLQGLLQSFNEKNGAFICCNSGESECCFPVTLSILQTQSGPQFSMEGDCSECDLSLCDEVCLKTGEYDNGAGATCVTYFDCERVSNPGGESNYTVRSCGVLPSPEPGPSGPLWYFDVNSAREECTQ